MERGCNFSSCVVACREYMNELPLRVNPFIRSGKDAEPGDYPHMVSGQANHGSRTGHLSRTDTDHFIRNQGDIYQEKVSFKPVSGSLN
jgi:hypothetical protein